MSRQEWEDLLLVYLYDKAEAEAHGFFFFPITEFATLAGITHGAEILAAARSLEDRGLVMLSQDLLGQVSALINLEGGSYVEKGGETGIIAKYRENPRAFLKEEDATPEWLREPEADIVQFSPDTMIAGGPAGKPEEAPATDLKPYIIRIINAILDDTAIDDVMRADLLRDAETLNIQLSKTTRNQAVINLLMTELASIPSISYLTAELSSFIQ
ncbi:MAG TPA: hypothetical protein VGJ94_02950 [Syntrophorhabdaceae bacterium]